MDEKARAAYLDGIRSLVEYVADDDAKKLFYQILDMAYANSERTLNQLIADCNAKWDGDDGTSFKDIAIKAFIEYRARVKMAMYYVQTFKTRKWMEENRDYSEIAWDKWNPNWLPYMGEVSEKLHLSEEEILCLARLYLNYFIAKAECDTGLNVEELAQKGWKYPSGGQGKKVYFQLFKVKDLAKMYMLQRFYARMNQARISSDRDRDIRNQVWRNILAAEEMSEQKTIRLKECPRENFAGSELELLCSLQLGIHVDHAKENDIHVLKAYELLNQGKDYDEVMDVTGLSFKEVRILDCFTIANVKEVMY